MLTEHLNRRWTLYISVAFAVLAFVAGSGAAHLRAPPDRPKLDLVGTVLVLIRQPGPLVFLDHEGCE